MLPVGLLPACPRPVRRPSPPVGRGCYHVTSGAVTCMSSPCSATVSTSREGCYHVTRGAVTCMSSPCSATVSTSREGVLPCYQWGCYLHVLALFGDRLHQSGGGVTSTSGAVTCMSSPCSATVSTSREGVLPCYQWGCHLHVLALFGDRLHQSGGVLPCYQWGCYLHVLVLFGDRLHQSGGGVTSTSRAVTCMSSPCSATVSTSREGVLPCYQ